MEGGSGLSARRVTSRLWRGGRSSSESPALSSAPQPSAAQQRQIEMRADSAGCQVIHLSPSEPRFILPRITVNSKFGFSKIYPADKKICPSNGGSLDLKNFKKKKKKGDIKGKTNIF